MMMGTNKAAALACLFLAACATTPGMRPAELRSSLTGLQAVPGPGAADGSGTAEIRVNPAASEICWRLYARGVDTATEAHIHRSAAGSAGPAVLSLAAPGTNGQSTGCAPIAQDLALEIATRPFNFYIDVHNAAFPSGAIRGQLRGELGRLTEEERRRQRQ
jgi:hypothetical protein